MALFLFPALKMGRAPSVVPAPHRLCLLIVPVEQHGSQVANQLNGEGRESIITLCQGNVAQPEAGGIILMSIKTAVLVIQGASTESEICLGKPCSAKSLVL